MDLALLETAQLHLCSLRKQRGQLVVRMLR
jgi:hypothetical protein